MITDRAGFYKEIANDSNRKFIQEALISIVTFGCFDVLNVFFESKPIDSLPRTHNETIYDRFISSLLLNYPSKRTVAFYAEEQHLSPAYFSVVIKEVSGKSVMQWIVDVTIMRAKQLLTGSQLSMKDIANEFNSKINHHSDAILNIMLAFHLCVIEVPIRFKEHYNCYRKR